MSYYILTEDHVPAPVESIREWARWFETHDRKVASFLSRIEAAP